MKFWQKDESESPLMQALMVQLEQKDSQISGLLERQRETNILLKTDQEQLLQLREAHLASLPYASLEDHHEQLFDAEKKIGNLGTELATVRAGANKSSFLNWLLLASILVLSYGFMYWVNAMSTASDQRSKVIEEMNFELGKTQNRISLLMRDLDLGNREVERLLLENAVSKEDLVHKEQESMAQLLTQSQRITKLEALNATLMAAGLTALTTSPPSSKSSLDKKRR